MFCNLIYGRGDQVDQRRKESPDEKMEGISGSELLFEQAVKLFRYVEKCFRENGCDETLRFTEQWLNDNVLPEKRKDVLGEMAAMSG